MRRIISLLTVLAVLAAMSVVMSTPAFGDVDDFLPPDDFPEGCVPAGGGIDCRRIDERIGDVLDDVFFDQCVHKGKVEFCPPFEDFEEEE